MLSNDEKNIFLQDLEEEQLVEERKTEPWKKGKGMSPTAIFASVSVFSIFMVLLLVFVLSLAETGNPVFQTFGIEAWEIKNFLKNLLNKSFFIIIIILLLSTAIGIFRGYSMPKEEREKRRKSFAFGGVAGGLIFLSLLSWGATYAFIEKFVTEDTKGKEVIDVINIKKGEKIIAPISIHFSAKNIVESLKHQGIKVSGFEWSKDGGTKFSTDGIETKIKFYQEGPQKVLLRVLLEDGKTKNYSIPFEIDEASFEVPDQIFEKQKTIFDAEKLTPQRGEKYEWDFDGDGIYETSLKSPKVSHIFKQPGSFYVGLRISFGEDQEKEFSRDIRVLPEGQESILASISSDQEFSGESPLTIELSGKDSYSEEGNITQYSWVIGEDKKRKNGIDISHTFETAGTYPVILTVTNEFGEKSTDEIFIEVSKGNSAPKAMISTLPKPEKPEKLYGSVPFEVIFSGEKSTDSDEDIVSYEWVLEDKTGNQEIFSGSEQRYTFLEKGEFTLSLVVTDSKGASDKTLYSIKVIEPVVRAVVRAEPKTGSAPLIVDFNASESTCSAELCTVNAFEWDFDDKTEVKRSGSHISHQFTQPGRYEVQMTAHTNTGEKSTTTSFINVTDQVFKACFDASRSKGVAPVKISFDPSTCSEGDIKQYKWDFNDGFISQKKKPSHTFLEAGEYEVTLQIFDKNGQVSQTKKTIIITNK